MIRFDNINGQQLTRNIRKPGDVGNLNFRTFTKNSNGLISWSSEIPAYAYCHPLGHMQKKTTDTLKMRSNKIHIVTQTDFNTGLTRLDQQCNQTRMTEREEKGKSPRFAFLKISAYAHCTHLQSRTSQPATQALQKSAILPSLNMNQRKRL